MNDISTPTKKITKKRRIASSKTLISHSINKNITQSQVKPSTNNKPLGEAQRKVYAKTIINTYVPLTDQEKIKECEDIHRLSSNRLKTYNNLFDTIKFHISELDTELNSNQNVMRKTKRALTLKGEKKINFNEIIPDSKKENELCFIEENEEENFFTPNDSALKAKKSQRKIKDISGLTEHENDNLNEREKISKMKLFPSTSTLVNIKASNQRISRQKRMLKAKTNGSLFNLKTTNKKMKFEQEFYGENIQTTETNRVSLTENNVNNFSISITPGECCNCSIY